MLPSLGRILKWIVLLPVLVAAGLFAVANNHDITVKLNPLDGSDAASTLEVPLYVIAFAAFALGAVCGGVAAWNRQRRYRREARQRRDQAAKWRVRAERAEGGPATPGAHLLPGPNT